MIISIPFIRNRQVVRSHDLTNKLFKSWLVGNFSVAKSCINDNDFCEISWGDTGKKIERGRDKEQRVEKVI